MNDNQFEQLMQKLDMLIKVSIAGTFKEKTKEDSILILSELGFQPKDIAPLLSTTTSYVGKVKSEAKKQKNSNKTEKKSDTGKIVES